jgi:hypothetical protein
MKKTYFYSHKHKQLEILKNNIKLSLFGETPTQPMFIHGFEYTEVREGENPKSNWEDAVIVFTETFELT